MKPSRAVAAFDSASAMLEALGAFLHGRDFPALGRPPPVRPVAPAVNLLPKGLREQAYIWSGWAEAIPARALDEIRAEEVARWVTSHYPPLRYPAVMLGSSNGAAVHLAAALGVPWLPQTLLVPVRRSLPPDEPAEDMAWGRRAASPLLEANPDLQLHHMHDANQDRLMIRRMTYFRVKRRTLGNAYQRFLEEALLPGGTILVVECTRRWPTVRIGPRHVFQPGAVGGATPDEYLRGGARVERFLEREGSLRRRWDPPEADGESPEAEWGLERALVEDVDRFASDRGIEVRRIVFEDPADLSPLVADLYRRWYRRLGVPSDRLLVESFILLEPWWALATGSVPFWTKFSVEPDARALERYLEGGEPFRQVLVTLFSHGVDSIGLARPERWRSIAQTHGAAGRFLGVDVRRFPRDFGVFTRFHRDLRGVGRRQEIPPPLGLADLEEFLSESREDYRVRWTEGTGLADRSA